MKRIISLMLVVIMCLSVLIVGTVSPSAAIQEGDKAVDFSWYYNTMSFNQQHRPTSNITVRINPLSNVSTYRYYYKLVDISGKSTGWVRAGEITTWVDNPFTVTVPIQSSHLNKLSTKGLYNNNTLKLYNNDKALKLYVTVRALSNGKFVTGFYNDRYKYLSTWDFCCQTHIGRDRNHCVYISAYLPLYSFAKDNITGVRFYYMTKNGTWETINTMNNRFATIKNRIVTTSCTIPDHMINNMRIDKDGDVCVTARLVNDAPGKGNPISPYFKQYWNFNKYLLGRN